MSLRRLPATTACDDGDACTLSDSCRDGVCEGDPIVCDGTPCAPGVCNPDTGACETAPLDDGDACDDSNACTTDDVCASGTCAGTPVDCSGLDGACTRGRCDEESGACVSVDVSDNTPCGEPAGCIAAQTCQSGECTDVAVACDDVGGQCEVASCDALTGGCVVEPAAAGGDCDDGDPCTENDTCDGAGGCAGTPIVCAGGDACNVAVCDPNTGACGVAAVDDGVGCDDEDACTVGDQCQAGVCSGDALDCAALAGPCRTGTCDSGSGTCVFADANEGGSCDDDVTDCVDLTCTFGSCAPTARAECAACGDDDELFCSAGVCGPTVPEVAFDFESGALPAGVLTGGDAAWAIELGSGYDGVAAARAGDIGDGASTSMELSFSTQPLSWIEFWVRTDSEAGDRLVFEVDGLEVASWSGVTSWTRVRHPGAFFETLGPGVHTFVWRYEKDGAGSAGADSAWVDGIRVANVADPIDFEDATLGPLSTTSPAFVIDDAIARFGARSLRVDSIADGTSASLTWDVNVQRFALLSFFYRLDAEAGDGLKVYFDGDPTPVFTALGTTDWQRTLFMPALAPGSHTIEFRYSMDASGRTGTDALWLDEITIGVEPCP